MPARVPASCAQAASTSAGRAPPTPATGGTVAGRVPPGVETDPGNPGTPLMLGAVMGPAEAPASWPKPGVTLGDGTDCRAWGTR